MCTVLGTPDSSEALNKLTKKIQGCEEVQDKAVSENQPDRIQQDNEILTFEGKPIKEMSPSNHPPLQWYSFRALKVR